ncbi:hypothetical protein JTE90_000681, partial [Oedothorax gibbosus]
PPKLTPIRISTKGKSTPKTSAKGPGGAAADPKSKSSCYHFLMRKNLKSCLFGQGRSSPQMAHCQFGPHTSASPTSTRGATPPLVNLPSTSFQNQFQPIYSQSCGTGNYQIYIQSVHQGSAPEAEVTEYKTSGATKIQNCTS